MIADADGGLGGRAKIDVFIVDDHPLIRDGLASFIGMQNDMRVCGSGSGIAEVLRELPRVHVDVMLIDLTLGNESGADLLARVRRDFPEIKPLIFTMHRNGRLLHQMLDLGARGFILKEDPTNMVLQGIRAVMAGGVFFSQSLSVQEPLSENPRDFETPLKSSDSVSSAPEADLVRLLTSREREILELIGQGKKSGEIAATLFLSSKTVNSHRENLKRKLGLRDAGELMAFAVRLATQKS